MSRAELARRAKTSPLTIKKIEEGDHCRPDTARRIFLALGFSEVEYASFIQDITKVAPSEPDKIKKTSRKNDRKITSQTEMKHTVSSHSS
jgi:transcriptional regulator with XRE-family HTH domain